jgi:hypothetical protein
VVTLLPVATGERVGVGTLRGDPDVAGGDWFHERHELSVLKTWLPMVMVGVRVGREGVDRGLFIGVDEVAARVSEWVSRFLR